MTNRADQNWPDEMITKIENENCSGTIEGFSIATLAADFFICLYDRTCARTTHATQGEGL